MAKSGMPWETGATEGKYKYHPGGDPSLAPKDAPSAVNVVVIPDVNLPKVGSPMSFLFCFVFLIFVLRYSRFYSTCTRSTTNGARTATRLEMGLCKDGEIGAAREQLEGMALLSHCT